MLPCLEVELRFQIPTENNRQKRDPSDSMIQLGSRTLLCPQLSYRNWFHHMFHCVHWRRAVLMDGFLWDQAGSVDDPNNDNEGKGVDCSKLVGFGAFGDMAEPVRVEQNRNWGVLWQSDTRKPRGIPQRSLGVARLGTSTWQKKRGGRE